MVGKGGRKISAELLRRRAKKIRLVLTDVDGVLTDAGIYYSKDGEELYRFSRRDGMGFDLLRAKSIEMGILTSENSEIVRRRAEKLKVRHIFLGVKDKAAYLPRILDQTGARPDEIAYIGDDVNDLGIIRNIGSHGITAAPADAVPPILKAVHIRCSLQGGHGAFRELADWLIDQQTRKR